MCNITTNSKHINTQLQTMQHFCIKQLNLLVELSNIHICYAHGRK